MGTRLNTFGCVRLMLGRDLREDWRGSAVLLRYTFITREASEFGLTRSFGPGYLVIKEQMITTES